MKRLRCTFVKSCFCLCMSEVGLCAFLPYRRSELLGLVCHLPVTSTPSGLSLRKPGFVIEVALLHWPPCGSSNLPPPPLHGNGVPVDSWRLSVSPQCSPPHAPLRLIQPYPWNCLWQKVKLYTVAVSHFRNESKSLLHVWHCFFLLFREGVSFKCQTH